MKSEDENSWLVLVITKPDFKPELQLIAIEYTIFVMKVTALLEYLNIANQFLKLWNCPWMDSY